ncbi:Smr/MutS family protein [Novosphingobium sp. BW1]|uniref:Smr/MutS family protein n=1 Tax=Novosphingobium sp. BW1 TaxID=2592621 RepID=UPI0011DEB184|nr:Smr/MutS family protein [Novosphingobium sp. BW1]TYC85309.1 DNA mismatch repair protein MutS [Novosphingobium sp. BW1]
MRRPGRRLSEDEARLWGEVARTVKPLEPAMRRPYSNAAVPAEKGKPAPPVAANKVKGRVPPPLMPKPAPVKVPKGETQLHLDGSWERRIAKGTLVPDFSLDLHGSNLDYAYRRLMDGLSQGKAMGARVVLVVTGKPRPVDAMDRGERRGAIRAKIKDWLMVSEHASDIVAIRGAHRRHGGLGALYIVLKRRR